MKEYLFPLVLSIHVIFGIGVVLLVLLQHGKGADMGAAFGSGASGSLFGASGSANFLSRTTAVMATLFFITSLGLSFIAGYQPAAPTSVMDSAPVAPAVPIPSDMPTSNAIPVPSTDTIETVPAVPASTPSTESTIPQPSFPPAEAP